MFKRRSPSSQAKERRAFESRNLVFHFGDTAGERDYPAPPHTLGSRGWEWQLQFDGRTARIWKDDLAKAYTHLQGDPPDMVRLSVRGLLSAKDVFNQFVELLGRGNDGWVPVQLAGSGSTDKSHKVRVDGVVHREYASDPRSDLVTTQHTLTIAKSLLREVEGHRFAPRWALASAILKRIGRWPVRINGGQFFEADALWEAIFKPLEEALAENAAEVARLREESRLAYERERPQREAALRRMEEERKAYRMKQEKRWAKEEENRNKLPAFSVASVRWHEWVKKPNGRPVQVEHETKECIIRLSGQRAYIYPPDQDYFIKQAWNVRCKVNVTDKTYITADKLPKRCERGLEK